MAICLFLTKYLCKHAYSNIKSYEKHNSKETWLLWLCHNPIYMQHAKDIKFFEIAIAHYEIRILKLVETIWTCCQANTWAPAIWPTQLMHETDCLIHQFGVSCAYGPTIVIRFFLWPKYTCWNGAHLSVIGNNLIKCCHVISI